MKNKSLWQYISLVLVIVTGFFTLYYVVILVGDIPIRAWNDDHSYWWDWQEIFSLLSINYSMFFLIFASKGFSIERFFFGLLPMFISICLIVLPLFYTTKKAKKAIIITMFLVAMEIPLSLFLLENPIYFILALLYKTFSFYALYKSYKYVDDNYEYYD